MYTTDAKRFVSWQGTRYETLDDFQAGSGLELNGISVEPGLSDPPAGDFTPTRRSPLVDRGVWLPGINDAFSGKGPDIGAREYVFSLVPLVPTLLLVVAWTLMKKREYFDPQYIKI